MLKNFQVQYAIYLFLVICVCSSNHIIIYNEELLVALCFLLFVVFVARYYGSNLKESLDSTSISIKEICEDLTNSKERELEKLSFLLSNMVKYKLVFSQLQNLTQNKISGGKATQESLISHFYNSANVQCSTINNLQDAVRPILVNGVAKNQMSLVLTEYAKQNSQGLDLKLLRGMIKAMQ